MILFSFSFFFSQGLVKSKCLVASDWSTLCCFGPKMVVYSHVAVSGANSNVRASDLARNCVFVVNTSENY